MVLVGRIREPFERFAPSLVVSGPKGGGVEVSCRLAAAGRGAPWDNAGRWCISYGASNGTMGFDTRGFVI